MAQGEEIDLNKKQERRKRKMDLYLKNDQLRDLNIGSGRGRRIAYFGANVDGRLHSRWHSTT